MMIQQAKKHRKPLSRDDKVINAAAFLLVTLVLVLTLYPLLFVISASFSDPDMVIRGQIWLFPKGITLDGYSMILKYDPIWIGYRNTIFYSVVGTTLNLLVTLPCAYALSRPDFKGRNLIMLLFTFTMFFSGGMIPTYLIVKEVGLLDTLWSLIIPGLISTYYVIILRTAIMGIPQEMTESAELDGANEFTILVRILIPLIIPTIAAIGLFIVVGYWNSWTSALLYIQDGKKQPLQMVLRQIVINNDMSAAAGSGSSNRSGEDQATRMLLKYATIMVSVIPIICVYPFLQKYFTKGVMIGALKG